MSTRLIVIAVAALVLSAAAWYFGRTPDQSTSLTTAPSRTATTAAPEKPMESAPKIIDVIDLARAYEPLREPAMPPGLDPASLIPETAAPRHIPYAVRFDNPYHNVIRLVEATSMGRFPIGLAVQLPEPISIPPRDVTHRHSGLLNLLPVPSGHLLFVPETPFISLEVNLSREPIKK